MWRGAASGSVFDTGGYYRATPTLLWCDAGERPMGWRPSHQMPWLSAADGNPEIVGPLRSLALDVLDRAEQLQAVVSLFHEQEQGSEPLGRTYAKSFNCNRR